MRTDWKRLNSYLEKEKNINLYGTDAAKLAFEKILGDDWIKNAVKEAINAHGNSSELAMNCLRHISSEKAAIFAYDIYKNSEDKDEKSMAVWLIKHLHVKLSFNWVEEFLNDHNVNIWGIGVLDQLLWCNIVNYNENKSKVDNLLDLAIKNSETQLKDNVTFIKKYLSEREE